MSWQQPYPTGGMHTIEMPCPRGCGGHWKHPAAEQGRVVEPAPDELPTKGGNVAASQKIGADFIVKALESWGIEHPALRDDR